MGFTNDDTTTRSCAATAAVISDRWPAWKKPIVGTNPTDPPPARAASVAGAHLGDGRARRFTRGPAASSSVRPASTARRGGPSPRTRRVPRRGSPRGAPARCGVAARDRSGQRVARAEVRDVVELARTSGRNASSGHVGARLHLARAARRGGCWRCTRRRGSAARSASATRNGLHPHRRREVLDLGVARDRGVRSRRAAPRRARDRAATGAGASAPVRARRPPSSASTPRAPGEVHDERVRGRPRRRSPRRRRRSRDRASRSRTRSAPAHHVGRRRRARRRSGPRRPARSARRGPPTGDPGDAPARRGAARRRPRRRRGPGR